MTPERASLLARRHNLRRVLSDDLVLVWWPNGSVYRWTSVWPRIPVVP